MLESEIFEMDGLVDLRRERFMSAICYQGLLNAPVQLSSFPIFESSAMKGKERLGKIELVINYLELLEEDK